MTKAKSAATKSYDLDDQGKLDLYQSMAECRAL